MILWILQELWYLESRLLRDKGAKAIYASCVHAVLSEPAIERLQAADPCRICLYEYNRSERESKTI